MHIFFYGPHNSGCEVTSLEVGWQALKDMILFGI